MAVQLTSASVFIVTSDGRPCNIHVNI